MRNRHDVAISGARHMSWTLRRLLALGSLLVGASACGSSSGGSAIDPDATNDTSGSIDVQGDDVEDVGVDATSADSAEADTSSADTTSADTASADTSSADTSSADTSSADTADVGLDPDACTAEQACNNGAFCLVPGGFLGCGICKKGEGCSADSECSANTNGICVFAQSDCTCDSVPLCHDGCAADGDCGVGEVCASDHHCKPAPCSANADCPTHFSCDATAKTCARTSCTASSACPGGHCVGGGCYAEPGSCAFPPP